MLLIKQHETGGDAFEKVVSWNLGRKGEGRIAHWSKALCCWKGRYLRGHGIGGNLMNGAST